MWRPCQHSGQPHLDPSTTIKVSDSIFLIGKFNFRAKITIIFPILVHRFQVSIEYERDREIGTQSIRWGFERFWLETGSGHNKRKWVIFCIPRPMWGLLLSCWACNKGFYWLLVVKRLGSNISLIKFTVSLSFQLLWLHLVISCCVSLSLL